MTAIVCDARERGSSIRRRLEGFGIEIEVARLAAGDYKIGESALIERKTVRDLHLTVVTGRFWFQIGRLRRGALAPYLLVEGIDLDDGPLSGSAVRGCLVTVADLGVGVIRSTGPDDSALWLARLHARHNPDRPRRTRPLYAHHPKPSSAVVSAEAALAAIPGISYHLASALLEHFGSLRGVLNASPGEWEQVPGIGPVKAAALAEAITTDHRPAR